MSYAAWSVIAGEQPTTSKWNILGSNDASFNDGSGLNAIANPITAASGNHLILQTPTGKLVKSSVLRQDDTTNNYELGNTVILTGWGVGVPGVANNLTETVTFGVTFTQRPIVILTFGGDNISGAATYGAGTTARKAATGGANAITTTNFVARIYSVDGSNWVAGDNVFYQWMAIGEL